MYVTAFYGVLDTRTGELAYANGGHNPPVIFSPDGEIRKLRQPSGPMVGLFGRSYPTLTTRLEPGQGILVHTDGVTDAVNRNDEFFEEERLDEFIKQHCRDSAPDLARGLHAAVKEFAAGVPLADDTTVLVLKYFGPC